MSERKYRQRGYQDDDRDRERAPRREGPGGDGPRPPRPPGRPAGVKTDREPRAFNVPAFQQTMKCTRCGAEIAGYSSFDARCTRCNTALHSCIQCTYFDPGSPNECMQRVPVRVVAKDEPNTCSLFEPRVQLERQTSSKSEGPTSAKDAFERLFKI